MNCQSYVYTGEHSHWQMNKKCENPNSCLRTHTNANNTFLPYLIKSKKMTIIAIVLLDTSGNDTLSLDYQFYALDASDLVQKLVIYS